MGILGLGTAIFVAAALLSLQVGTGRLMGPFGRAAAVLVYGFGGMCSYLLAIGLAVVAIRLLLDRPAALRGTEVAGVALGFLSLATLAHLVGPHYRVAHHAPGGLVGEHVAEVLRAVISTAGTALVALMGLVMAAIIATPLRMSQVVDQVRTASRVTWCTLRWAGGHGWRGLCAFGAWCGEVVRALLPERDHDDYLEREAAFVEPAYDAYQVAEEAPELDEPPIIDSRPVAVPQAIADEADAGDTEKMDRSALAAALAEARAESIKPRADEGKTLPGVGPTLPPAPLAEAEEVDEADVVAEEALAGGEAAGPRAPSQPPVIVESRFRALGAAELQAREKQLEAERRGFITLGASFQLPPIQLLDYDETRAETADKDEMLEVAARLTQTLEHFKIKGDVVAIRPGPVVTMYEFAPAPGTRLNKIVSLADDLAMALEALRVRIVAPIPGKAAVGIEVPNRTRETVYLKEILADDSFRGRSCKLPLAMGKDIEGAPVVVDLGKMPHLLVAGTTGSGKSVSVNSMIASLLYNSTPEEVRMIMVDPKMLELSVYEGIPHLLLPVVTDPKKANLALRWAVEEMDRRYQLLSDMRVRDIAGYNKKVDRLIARAEADRLGKAAAEAARRAELEAEEDEQVEITEERGQLELLHGDEPPQRLPYIVIIIDEFADLMMCAPKDVETSVARIAQKARASGIHLVLATQRPSVNVITGLIKANFPSRTAFFVTSKVDSRTILDQHGAERLLGAGDMLFSDRGAAPRRVHGCFVGEEEIHRLVEFLKQQGRPVYNLDIIKPRDDDEEGGGGDISPDELDEMYDRACAIVQETRQVSISMIQ
ncbi:MAG TPA: DNA translocase FtsK 4TM domain-containing protein, partial [Kofleriaceae bacterium]|nr:DNA translocase FtsK 4TM domain-containing protein [Kofleriaceae bacterium]